MRSWRLVARSQLLARPASFTGDVITSITGSIFARVVILAAMPIVTRIYTPHDLGVWAIILSLSVFFLPLATLRYETAIVIAPTKEMAAALVVVIGACTLAVAILLAVMVATAPYKLLEMISGLAADKQGLLSLVPLALVITGVQAALQAWLTRERNFHAINLAQVLQALVTAGSTLLFPIIAGANAVVASIAALVGMATSVALTAWIAIGQIRTFTHTGLPAAARLAVLRFKVYPLFYLPYALSSGLSERVLQIVLASAYSLSALGAFYIARQLITAPVVLVTASLRQVLFAHSAGQTDLERTKQRVGRILRLIINVQAAGLGFGFFWLKPILTELMGADWTRVSDFGWWVLFPASMLMLTGWLDRLLDVLGRQRLAVTLQLSSDFVLIWVVLLSPRIGLDDVGMVAALSIGIALYNYIWLVITLHLLRFGFGEMATLSARGVSLCILWSSIQFLLITLIPGLLGFLAACLVLVLSIAPTAFQIVRGRFES